MAKSAALSAYRAHVSKTFKDHPGMPWAETIKLAASTWKRPDSTQASVAPAAAPRKIRSKRTIPHTVHAGAIGAKDVIEGISSIGDSISTLGSAISDAMLRKRIYDQAVAKLGDLLRDRGYSGVFDRRVQDSYNPYAEGKRGAGLIDGFAQLGKRVETRNAKKDLLPALKVLGISWARFLELSHGTDVYDP